ncbi:protein-(glutamine-N5) methyltransferase, releas e factor-specific [Desulfonema ishimotonii]|uniref:Release factor glutamine methyltransferase n=1 Tax=Desulfonema ishimotonii TaxID=45657 RepID=A0A401FQQ7_9BACT|nr:peptide chain release factor N(5)-glutamine methyltransferase [Desulfonema ishimotonii]GBC59294.1 protein-(glutamine-N5) methyltransferase, releas e factor-specific [Desulfonema ishimotonii]
MQNQTKNGEAPWTILKLLRWTTSYFKSHDIDNPRASAELLLAHALKLERIDLYVRYDQPLSGGELSRFKALIKRRGKREPIAYITGEKEFWSMPLKVSPAVLIPRPETECLVEAALAVLPDDSDGDRKKRVLELGTGSGAIILSLASERPGHRYFASDRSLSALAVARENAVRHGAEAIRFFCGDWFEALKGGGPPFDLILSNPPYIEAAEIPRLQPEIHRYEPVAALDGGTDGLDALRHIICHAPACLADGGTLILEIGYDQGDAVQSIARGCGAYYQVAVRKDYSGHDRVVLLRRGQAPDG